MIQVSHSETGYSLSAFRDAFQTPAFGFLPGDLAIQADEHAPRTLRTARLFLDRDNKLVLEIQGNGFSKEELLLMRNQAQSLERGTDVIIEGIPHCMALSTSRMIIDDHEVSSLSLIFQLEPYAAAA